MGISCSFGRGPDARPGVDKIRPVLEIFYSSCEKYQRLGRVSMDWKGTHGPLSKPDAAATQTRDIYCLESNLQIAGKPLPGL
jgi:hypothetical protein